MVDGCNLYVSDKDYGQILDSRSRQHEFCRLAANLELGKREIQAELHKASAARLVDILSSDKNHAFGALQKLLAKATGGEAKMSDAEYRALPEAMRLILKDHPNAMGLFEKVPSHRGPGSSAVQHPYEVFSVAALKVRAFNSSLGKTLAISPLDRVDFGLKAAKGYAQPKRYGTIEFDAIISKPIRDFPLEERTIAVDAKHSKTGVYGAKPDLDRELQGIRTALRDGKINEFYFVTNGIFDNSFRMAVDAANVAIVRDWAEAHNRLWDTNAHLTAKESEFTPSGRINIDEFTQYDERLTSFALRYDVPQVDICQRVNFPGT